MSSAQESEAGPAFAAPSALECLGMTDAYHRWADSGLPVTQNEFAALDANAAKAAISAGQDLIADLRQYPSDAFSKLRHAADEFVEEMHALETALRAGTSTHKQVATAHTACVSVHQEFTALTRYGCCS